MNHTTSFRYIVKHWQLFAMRDGYTLHNTVIDAEKVPGGYLPAFIGHFATRVVIELKHPLPTAMAARNCLRDVLWGAHVEHRISLLPHPLEADTAQEQAA